MIGAADDLKALEEARIAALGRKGRVAELMGRFGALAPDQRKSFGQAVNGLKQRVSEALEGRKAAARQRPTVSQACHARRADITPAGARRVAAGGAHPSREPGVR